MLTVVMILPPYMTKLLIDQVYPNQDETLLYLILVATALMSTFSSLVGQIRDYFVSFVNMRMSLGTNFEFYRHLAELDIDFFAARRVGEISSRARDALDSVGGIMQLATAFITNSITLLIFPPLLLFINWKLALLALAIVPVDFCISLAISKYSASKTRQVATINAQVNAQKIELLSGMSTIQALSIQESVLERIRKSG